VDALISDVEKGHVHNQIKIDYPPTEMAECRIWSVRRILLHGLGGVGEIIPPEGRGAKHGTMGHTGKGGGAETAL